MKQTLAILVLVVGALGADKPKVPQVPPDYQIKIMKLVIQQKNLRLQMSNDLEDYKNALEQLKGVNVEGQKAENELLESLHLDPNDYTTNTTPEGEVVIVKKESPEPKK